MVKIYNKSLKKSLGYRKGSRKYKENIAKIVKKSKKCYSCSNMIGGEKEPGIRNDPNNLLVNPIKNCVNISRTLHGEEIPTLEEIREIYQKKKK